MTQRWKITIEYHGAPFVGWQLQEGLPSVQREVEAAIHLFSGETVRTVAAGRTDAGVHAMGQVAHFDIEKSTTAFRLRDALNAHLRYVQITVLAAEPVEQEFDARLSAKRRHYRYRILNRRPPEAIEEGRVWHVAKPLDQQAMHDAAQILVGRHDFTTFRAAACQALSPVRSLESVTITRNGEEIIAEFAARSFLHHQVRNIMGTLKLVGEGKWTAERLAAALNACDRSAGGPTAPACALYFIRVEY